MGNRKRHVRAGSLVAAGMIAPLAVPEARAQQQAGLDEIVVSARRREENVQDIPLAITAISGNQLEASGVVEMQNLNAMVPNLSVQGGSGRGIESQATFRVRGMPGVAVYVDGIDQTSSTGLFTMGVIEVDRIEVLRGPQGTLFGNSALSGAVQYVTRRPGDEFGARVQATTGTYDRRDIMASIDVPVTENFLTKFTFADLTRNGFMNSIDSGRKYGDINDQFYRGDFLFTPTDKLSFRYAFDTSTQDRQGGARAVWEIGPMQEIQVGNSIYNSNAQAQAFLNAFGIVYDDRNVSSGYPGGVVGEYETRVAHETPGLFLDLKRHTFQFEYDINDQLTFRTIAGRRDQERRLMVDFDSDSRVDFADRQDHDRLLEETTEIQLVGSFGERSQFNWVLGGFFSDRGGWSHSPTFSGSQMICDLLAAKPLRGVTATDEASCFNNRMRALNLQGQFVANSGMTSQQIAALWQQAAALRPNYRGVTTGTFATMLANSFDGVSTTEESTTAYFADLVWDVTDKLTLAFGARTQDNESRGTWFSDLTNAAQHVNDPFPWNDVEYTLRDPYGVSAVTRRGAGSEFSKTTSRVSVQYQWRDDLMTYLTLSNGFAPGGVSNVPITIQNQLSQLPGGAVPDLPFEMIRDEETIDNYEIGVKADWLDGRLRTNASVFYTDWRNMAGSTYVATVWWDTDANGFADSRIPCAVRCSPDGLWEVQYFPNLLNSGVRKAEASGVEFELNYRAGAAFQLGFNLGLLNSEFVELGQAGEGTVPAYTRGDSFAGAPDMTANVWGQYDWSLQDNRSLSARFDYTWTDDFTTFAGGPLQRTQEAFGLLNARFVYDSGQNWSVIVAGQNLTNEYYSLAYFYTVSQQLWQGSVGRPREVSLGLNFTF
jgi:iron complex outermembrane receptor protein